MVSPGKHISEVECLPKGRLERPYNNWRPPGLPTRPSLILCATEQEVKYAAGATDLRPDALIALTPQAACQCYLQGIPYYKLEDFFDLTAFWDGDEPMLALESRWSDRVDAFLWQATPEFRDWEFRPAGSYFFWLKVVIDMLFRASFGLAHLLLASSSGQVYYFASEVDIDAVPSHKEKETLLFNTPLHSFILPACAAVYRISVTKLPAPTEAISTERERAIQVRSSIRRLINSLPPGLQYTLRRVKKHGINGLRPSSDARHKGRRGEVPEIILGNSFDLDRILLEDHGVRVTPIEDVVRLNASHLASSGLLARQLSDSWAELSEQPFFREPFTWCGVDLFDLARSRLQYWLEVITPKMWQMGNQARQQFERKRPGAILFYSPWSVSHFAATQAARSLDIPVVTHQHGSFECEFTTLDMVDMRMSDYRLVYGEGQASYLTERSGRYKGRRAQVLAVGSAYVDALVSAHDRRAKTRRELGVTDKEQLVVYIPTSYQYNWYMARQSYLGVPYFDLLTKVIETIAKFSGFRFVYKPFPELPPDPMVKVIAERYTNIEVTDIPPPRLFQASDAIIVDLPSTALLEGLLSNKPMVVFSDPRCIALRPEARELLRKRVSLSETPEDFLQQLEGFLSKGHIEPLRNPNREFLQLYGTHLDDGHSAERAINALREIVQTHLPRHADAAC